MTRKDLKALRASMTTSAGAGGDRKKALSLMKSYSAYKQEYARNIKFDSTVDSLSMYNIMIIL